METEIIEKKPELIILIGCQGTGKSTWANKKVNEDHNFIVVSRDNIRRLLYNLDENFTGYWDINSSIRNEELITSVEEAIIIRALQNNKSVIIDATNVELKYIRRIFIKYSPYFGVNNIYSKVFGEYDNPDNKHIYWSRTNERGSNPISMKDISSFFDRTANLLKDFDYKIEEIKKEIGEGYLLGKMNIINKEKDLFNSCVIFDIDGTLAIHNNRGPFEYEKCINDIPCEEVKTLLWDIEESVPSRDIIICSGRPETFRKQTEAWLNKNDLVPAKLYMRKENDFRPDYIVKSEMWREILKNYYIEYMVDDRPQVINYARNCGFFVFQVQDKIF